MISSNELEKNTDEKKVFLDINCDLAQSFGVYRNDMEYELLPYVSSVNISCGMHSGDPMTINKALKIAAQNNLSIGAHIGYPDLQGFGYREMDLTEEEIEAIVLYQIGALSAMAKAQGCKISHVRLHGALYKKAITDFRTMCAIVNSIKKAGDWLILLCAPCPNLEKACNASSLKYAAEIFPDKKYSINGEPLFEENEIIDVEFSKMQIKSIIENSEIININGGKTKIDCHSIHLNMKNALSLEIAQTVKEIITQPVPLPVSILEDKSWI